MTRDEVLEKLKTFDEVVEIWEDIEGAVVACCDDPSYGLRRLWRPTELLLASADRGQSKEPWIGGRPLCAGKLLWSREPKTESAETDEQWLRRVWAEAGGPEIEDVHFDNLDGFFRVRSVGPVMAAFSKVCVSQRDQDMVYDSAKDAASWLASSKLRDTDVSELNAHWSLSDAERGRMRLHDALTSGIKPHGDDCRCRVCWWCEAGPSTDSRADHVLDVGAGEAASVALWCGSFVGHRSEMDCK